MKNDNALKIMKASSSLKFMRHSHSRSKGHTHSVVCLCRVIMFHSTRHVVSSHIMNSLPLSRIPDLKAFLYIFTDKNKTFEIYLVIVKIKFHYKVYCKNISKILTQAGKIGYRHESTSNHCFL